VFLLAWEVTIEFKIHGKRMGADGLAFWYTAQQGTEGPVYGSNDKVYLLDNVILLFVCERKQMSFFFFHTLVKWNELIFLQWVGLGVFFDTFDNNGRVLYLWILISSVYIYLSLSFVSLYPPAFLAGGLTCTCVALLTAQGYLNTISAVMNDGTKTYDHASDGETMALGVCRCAPLLHLYSAARDDGDGDGGWTGG
jgi:hypothetical protein